MHNFDMVKGRAGHCSVQDTIFYGIGPVMVLNLWRPLTIVPRPNEIIIMPATAFSPIKIHKLFRTMLLPNRIKRVKRHPPTNQAHE